MTSEPSMSEPESWPFPVLGISPQRWDGIRRLALRSAVGPSRAETVTVAVTHTYYLSGARLPAAVISQAPAYPGRAGPNPGSALSLLLRSKERPTVDEPAETVRRTIRVAGVDVDAAISRWPDARIQQARFDWLDRRVGIATWRFPLDRRFFQLLDRLGIGT